MRIKVFHNRNPKTGKPDFIILAIVFVLIVFGMVALGSASSNLGQKQFNDSSYYVKHQLTYGFGIGFLLFCAALVLPYHRYERLAVPLLLVSLGLLLVVFTPLGFSSGGALRWVRIGSLTIQPAEILKITFIIYLAAWFSKRKNRRSNLTQGFIPFIIMIGIIATLLLKQPSTSTVLILMSVALVMYFMSGAPWRYLCVFGLAGAIGFAAIIYFAPYRLERLSTFLHPEAQPLSSGYQLYQALLSIGSGGFSGVGYGKSIAKVYYLPEPIGDSIFAVIAEEFGFIGAMLLILAFCALVLRILFLARRCDDQFGKLLLVGFGSLIGIQAFVNMGAISGAIPLTGTPLPFISYGGTALLVFMTIAGILANISRYARK